MNKKYFTNFYKKIKKNFFRSTRQKNTHKWRIDKGEETLRINYNLTSDSVVFDIGGYKGAWSDKIYNKYNCNIYIFEPVGEFFDEIIKKFSGNNKIKIFNFGLSEKDCLLDINVNNDNSSANVKGDSIRKAEFKNTSKFIKKQKIENIDLMKINIEGDEYSLLNDLINSNTIKKIKNIQVQFHDFIPNANKKMKKIQKR